MVKKVSSGINSNDPPAGVLADVLDTLRFRGSIFFRSSLASPWGMSLSNLTNPRFHIALSGDCYIGVDDASSTVINMQHMDILMLPHGDMHWIADQPGRELTPSEQAGDACELGLPLFQNGKITNKLICGLINYEKDVLHPLIDALPTVLHFPDIKQDDPVWMTVLLIDAEMEKAQTNHTSIIDRLTEVLFMQLLNKHMNDNKEITGFFAALHDKRICRALELIHKNPEHPWTIDLLTEQVNLSRATLTRQFNATVGVPPMTYLLKWRMIKAHNLIKHSSKTIDEISGMVGFSSARTLTKAFLNHYKMTPSQLRRK
ncbi:MAG: AraC family transcriptional regulator [Gammaproteobacteria bacterium]|nr:AraC family transcriptional regulator [Gammaproteobacteria bacterium]MBL4899179.1 AraC family transcriptional regulator [Colwellia sp.]